MATKQAPAIEASTGFENAKFDLREIPINEIHLGKYSLRDVDRNSEDYQRLRDSIAATGGPYMSIVVREIELEGKPAFGLIDGLQRYSSCLDLGFKKIGARVVGMNDAEVAKAQIIANRSRIETKPVEYTNQLRRMLNSDPTLTLEELAEELHCSVKWLQDRLSLANLHPDLQALVDDGRIPLAHAFALAKLKPKEEQLNFAETAQTQNIQEFSGHVTNRAKALKDASRAGREAGSNEWKPVAHMRPVKDIKEQFENPTIAEEICEAVKADTAEAGFHAALKWVLMMDPATVEVLRQKAVDDKKKAEDARKKVNAEKAQKKADEARAAALGVKPEDLPKYDDDNAEAVAVGGGGDDEDDEDDE